MNRFDLSPQQKAADFTAKVIDGGTYSTSEVAQMYGMTPQGANFMLGRISAVIPIVRHEITGKWYLFDNK